MPTIDMQVTSTVPELYQSAVRHLNALRVNKMVAYDGQVLTQKWLRGVSNQRDHGSRFYENYADSVTFEASDSEAMVVIPATMAKASEKGGTNPLAAHYLGYHFTQANLTDSKNYTIPIIPQARYRRAREFPELKPIFRSIGGHVEAFALGMLNTSAQRKKAAKRGLHSVKTKQPISTKFTVWYLLVKEFTLRQDRSILPSEDEYLASGVRTLSNILARFKTA